jgi:hypothetical protein
MKNKIMDNRIWFYVCMTLLITGAVTAITVTLSDKANKYVNEAIIADGSKDTQDSYVSNMVNNILESKVKQQSKINFLKCASNIQDTERAYDLIKDMCKNE